MELQSRSISGQGSPQRVIYQCSEDGVSDTIKPRLEKCGADCQNIAFINEEVHSGLKFYALSVVPLYV